MKEFSLLRILKVPTYFAAWFRAIISVALLYKLFSKDYSILGYLNSNLVNVYNYETLPSLYINDLGIFSRLLTFHWIHFLIPLPNQTFMFIFQILLIGLLMISLVSSRRLLSVLIFVMSSYLFGFLWRTGNDVDAIEMQLQLLLLLAFYKGNIGWRAYFDRELSEDSAWLFKFCILVIVI